MSARRLLASASLATLAVAAPGAAGPAESDPPTHVRTVLEPRAIGFPGGISLKDHLLYVVQPAIDALSRVDLRTGEVEMLASDRDPDHEELVTPDDLWVDPVTGDAYVTEFIVNGVRKVAPDGTRTRILVGFAEGNQFVNEIALDAITGVRRPGEGLRLFVSTFSLNPEEKTGIYEIDPQGLVPPRLVYGAAGGVDVFGEGLRGPDSLSFGPDGRELFVAELHGGRVWAIDVDRHTARLVYDPSVSIGTPFGIVRAAPDGTLLYGEHPTGRVLRLRPEGPPDQQPRVVATVEPGLHNLTADPDGRIYTSGLADPAMVAIEPNGRTHDVVPGTLSVPNGLSALPDGRLLVGDHGSVAIVDPRHGGPKRLSRPWRMLIEGFDITSGVAVTGECTAYATAQSRGNLQRLDTCNPDAEVTSVLPDRTMGLPGDIAAGEHELWITGLPGRVWHVTGLDGDEPTASPLPAFFSTPSGLALGARGLYVSEADGDRVRIVDPQTGETRGEIIGLVEPEGLAFESDGSLLVIEAGRGEPGRLTRIRPDGTREEVLGDLATNIRGVSVIPGYNDWADVAVTAEGEIVVTSPEDGSLTLVPPPG